MSATVLLTGATGFVGTQILDALIELKCSVRVVTRQNHHDLANKAGIESVCVTSDMFSEDQEWWSATLQNIHTVIHAAWYVEPGMYLQSPENVHCLEGSLALARAALKAGVSKFVGLGTCFEYDVERGTLDTSTPLNPDTLYAATKAATYLTLSNWLAQTNTDFVWCRLFYLYGDGEDKRRFVAYLHDRLKSGEVAKLTTGTQIRDFMDVRDAGKQIAHVALSNQNGPVNICSGKGISIKDLAIGIAKEYGRVDLLAFGERPDNLQDPEKIIGVPNIQLCLGS